MTYSCTCKIGEFIFDVKFDGNEDDFWIESITLDGKDCDAIINSKVEEKCFDAASDAFWENYAENMTCRAEDRYDYLTDR